jgi:3-deoxy-D-manno-octulosonic-acid transferase
MKSLLTTVLLWIYRFTIVFLYLPLRLISLFYYPASFKERLGYYSPKEIRKLAIGYNVWLHAASAGEVNAITPFCHAFRKAKPEARIILTTTSEMGKKIALEKEVADDVFLAPLDMTPPLKRAFQAFRPVMILVAETEFWPNWFLRTVQNGVPLLLINGRISDRSFPSYRRLKNLFAPALNCFNTCLVQTRQDADRLEILGVSRKRIQVIGQMKYDRQAPDALAAQKFKEKLRLLDRDILFTLGSLRSGEDDQLLPLLPEILRLSSDVKVLIAPRHLKNVETYRQKLQALGVSNVFRSELEKGLRSERVIVLDTVGELSLAYALSRAAFVGGTLVPVGGHNVMEPALSYVPVCFGRYTQNVGEAAQALIESGGGFLVDNGPELLRAFQKFLDSDLAREAGNRAYDSVASMRGATERTVQQVVSHWPINLAS